MSTSTNTTTAPAAIRVASEVYAAFARGDVPAILDHLAEDVEWDVFADSYAARAGVPWLTPRRSPQEVTGFFADIGAATMRAFEVQAIVGDDETAVARIVVELELPGGGALRDEELHLWRLAADGRVTEFRHYTDTAKHIAAAAGEDTRMR